MAAFKTLFAPRPDFQITPEHKKKPQLEAPHGESKIKHGRPVTLDHLTSALHSTTLGSTSNKQPPKSSYSLPVWKRTFTVSAPDLHQQPQDQNTPYVPQAGPSRRPARTPSPVKPATEAPAPLRAPAAAFSSSPPATPPRRTAAAGSSASPRRGKGAQTPTAQPVQCSGITSAGKRCTRTINTNASPSKAAASVQSPGPAYAQLQVMLPPGQDNNSEEVPLFCHQHAKQALSDEGVYAGPSGLFTRFDEWIPNDLPPQTQAQLRLEMSKPVSASDKPGYIYVHEMVPTSGSHTALVKIGRSVKPVARLEQWRQACPTRQPVVRDFFPLAPGHPLLLRYQSLDCTRTTSGQVSAVAATSGVDGPSRLRGALSVSEPCPLSHRWERLVLLEVAGRARVPGYAPFEAAQEKQPCADCGKLHIELFTLLPGAYDAWVAEIILRWHLWCRQVLS